MLSSDELLGGFEEVFFLWARMRRLSSKSGMLSSLDEFSLSFLYCWEIGGLWVALLISGESLIDVKGKSLVGGDSVSELVVDDEEDVVAAWRVHLRALPVSGDVTWSSQFLCWSLM